MPGYAAFEAAYLAASFPNEMTITIEYEDEDVVGVDESTLVLYTWNGSQWVDAEPCGGYICDLGNNILKSKGGKSWIRSHNFPPACVGFQPSAPGFHS